MKRIILFLIIAILIGAIVYSFMQTRQSAVVQTVDMIQSVQGYPVEIISVGTTLFRSSRQYTGTVMGNEETEVFATIGEHISEVLVKEGQRVSQGEVIFRLSQDNPQAGLKSMQLAYSNAEIELKRIETLFEQGAISKQMLDGVTLQHDLAKEALETASELLDLTAPIAGKISQLTAEVGTYALPGIPLAKIVSQGKSRVKVKIPAADRDNLSVGQSCEVRSRITKVAGKISRLAESANPDGRYFEAWIVLLENPNDYSFSPGLSTEITIHLIDLSEAITLPYSAIIRNGDEYATYVVQDDKALLRDIMVGGTNATSVLVVSGIVPGESVVTRGASLLENNAPVRIISGN
ncbi:efflux RND transporter periplasmic adaptor subunit [Calditrichota bacterium]